uniref:Uncharacterized protein n=1 Tax=Ascaris lumbricoides TaxID=6252 RepID=A0A0M3I134_ASCLU
MLRILPSMSSTRALPVIRYLCVDFLSISHHHGRQA